MNEKWKKERSLLECLFQKRIIYTQVNWEWNIRSDPGAFDALLYIPIGGNHIFSTFFIPHTTLGNPVSSVPLLSHFCHLTKTSNHSHKSHHSLIHTNWDNYKAYFPSWRVVYTILIFFSTRLFIPSKLKAYIASPTHQNWDT